MQYELTSEGGAGGEGCWRSMELLSYTSRHFLKVFMVIWEDVMVFGV